MSRRTPIKHKVSSYKKEDGTKVKSHVKGSGVKKSTPTIMKPKRYEGVTWVRAIHNIKNFANPSIELATKLVDWARDRDLELEEPYQQLFKHKNYEDALERANNGSLSDKKDILKATLLFYKQNCGPNQGFTPNPCYSIGMSYTGELALIAKGVNSIKEEDGWEEDINPDESHSLVYFKGVDCGRNLLNDGWIVKPTKIIKVTDIHGKEKPFDKSIVKYKP